MANRIGYGCNIVMAGLLLPVAACAPSSLYTGSMRGNWTVGEIPRDARGEPVWAAIPPVPSRANGQQVTAIAAAWPAVETQEGDAEERPLPPRR